MVDARQPGTWAHGRLTLTLRVPMQVLEQVQVGEARHQGEMQQQEELPHEHQQLRLRQKQARTVITTQIPGVKMHGEVLLPGDLQLQRPPGSRLLGYIEFVYFLYVVLISI